MLRGVPIIGVIGSGTEEHQSRAEPLGRRLAEAGFHLLTGGGQGVMAAVSRGFASVADRRGLAIGIIPGRRGAGPRPIRYEPKPGYPNRWVDLAIYTHLPLSGGRGTDPLSRNHIVILTADLIVALPGGSGTRSELELAGAYGKPVILFGPTQDRGAAPPGARSAAGVGDVMAAIREEAAELE